MVVAFYSKGWNAVFNAVNGRRLKLKNVMERIPFFFSWKLKSFIH